MIAVGGQCSLSVFLSESSSSKLNENVQDPSAQVSSALKRRYSGPFAHAPTQVSLLVLVQLFTMVAQEVSCKLARHIQKCSHLYHRFCYAALLGRSSTLYSHGFNSKY